MRLFAFLALENLEGLDCGASEFIKRSLLPTITNMILYDIPSETEPAEPRMVSSLRLFCSKNQKILEILFLELSERFMSGPPLLYILSAISEKWENPRARTCHQAVQNFVTKVLKTHSTRLRSASQSLLIQILAKSDFDQKLLVNTLSTMNFLEPSSTNHCFEVLKSLPWSKQDIALENRGLSDEQIHQILLQSILSRSDPVQSRFSAVFDSFSVSAETLPKVISVIKFLSKYMDYRKTPLTVDCWDVSENLVISFLEFLFLVLSSSNRLMNQTFFETIDQVINLTKCFLDLLPEKLKNLSCKKLSEIIIGRVQIGADEQTIPLLLRIFEILPANETSKKVADEMVKSGSLEIWLRYQSDDVITASWSVLDRVPNIPVEKLIDAACESMERCGFRGQINIMNGVRKNITRSGSDPVPNSLQSLIRLGWDAVRNSFHTRFASEVYETFCGLVMTVLRMSDQTVLSEMFEKIHEKSKTRHGILLPFYREYFAMSKTSDFEYSIFDSRILETALLAGTGFNRDITAEFTAVDFAKKLQAEKIVDIVEENKFYVDVLNEMNDVRLLAINTICEENNIFDNILMLIGVSERETKKHPRYHPESATHKLKERSWQTVVFLLKKNESTNQLASEQICKIFDKCLENINADEQNSVLCLQQLAIVLCLEKDNSLWNRSGTTKTFLPSHTKVYYANWLRLSPLSADGITSI